MKRRSKQASRRKRSKVERLTNRARDALAALAGLAHKGEYDAALELYRATHLGVGLLHMTSITNPEVIRVIAKDQTSWPVMFNPHRDDIKEKTNFVRTIGLGSETDTNFMHPRAPSAVSNPAIAVVEDLHKMARVLIGVPKQEWTYREWLQCGPITKFAAEQVNWIALEAWGQTGAGSRLPKLSKATAHLWANATVELFDLVYRDKFDEDPDLADLKHHHRHARDSAGVKNGVSAVKRAMRKAVKQAWRGYAAKG